MTVDCQIMLVNFTEDQAIITSKLSKICIDLRSQYKELNIAVVDQAELAGLLDRSKTHPQNDSY